MRMKQYQNGMPEHRSDFLRAKTLLLNAGIYRTLGNFSPHTEGRASRIHKVLETLVIEDMEFTIIESEVMSFSFDSMRVSAPYIQKEAWFQPLISKS